MVSSLGAFPFFGAWQDGSEYNRHPEGIKAIQQTKKVRRLSKIERREEGFSVDERHIPLDELRRGVRLRAVNEYTLAKICILLFHV